MQPHLHLAFAKLNNTQKELKISQDTTNHLAVKVTALENQLELFHTTLNSLSLRTNNGTVEKVRALENKVCTFKTRFRDLEGEVDEHEDRLLEAERVLNIVDTSNRKLWKNFRHIYGW